jgi:ABC-2 type transport system ATP-binding protein
LIELSIGSDTNPLELDTLQQIDGVGHVGADNGTIRIQAVELHRVLPALLEDLRRRDIRITELRTHSASLEDVFVSLTGRHLRDE